MKRILTNISFNFLIRLTSYVFSLLALLYAARILQPDTFGRFSFATAFAGCFVMLANLGMPIYAMRACAKRRNIGAAITTVATEIIVWLVCAYYAKKDLAMDFGFGLFLRVMRRAKKILYTAWAHMENKMGRDKLPFYCPCCDTYLKRFISGSFDKRPDIYNPARYMNMNRDVICPVCGSLPRHRIFAAWLDDHIACVKEKRILHFAQERCIRMWMERNGVSAIAADLYSEADLKLDMQATGLPDGSYDVIISNHVLEHIDDFRRAIKEMFRVLDPRGIFICSFPRFGRQKNGSGAFGNLIINVSLEWKRIGF